jgi:hypothetical protein
VVSGLSFGLGSLLVKLAEEKHLFRYIGQPWMFREHLPKFARRIQHALWLTQLAPQLDGAGLRHRRLRILSVFVRESRECVRCGREVRQSKQAFPIHAAGAIRNPRIQRVS